MPSVSHDNKTLPFKPGQILLAIYHSQTKLKVGSINSIFISCIRQQNPLTVLSKIILRKVKQFNLPPQKNEGFLHF